MKRYVNGVEAELVKDAAHVRRSGDRLIVQSSQGTFSGLAVRDG